MMVESDVAEPLQVRFAAPTKHSKSWLKLRFHVFHDFLHFRFQFVWCENEDKPQGRREHKGRGIVHSELIRMKLIIDY